MAGPVAPRGWPARRYDRDHPRRYAEVSPV